MLIDTCTSAVPVYADGQGSLSEICLSHSQRRLTEKAFFHYEPDSQRYDNYLDIRVTYSRNMYPHLANCLENQLLNSTYSTTKRLSRIRKEVLPYVLTLREFFFPATVIRIETQSDGRVAYSTHQDFEVLPESILPKFPEVPQSLAHVPAIPLTQISRASYLAYDVDVVTWPGEPEHEYAFKKITHESRMLTELQTLNALQFCSGINPMVAIVYSVPQDHNGVESGPRRIRGFLARYLPAGDLGEYLETRMHQRLDLDALEISPGVQAERRQFDGEFPWKVKLMWATTLARTLVYMHSRGIVSGDLKPDNVLIDPEGNVKLMDFGPVGPTEGWGAPEYSREWVAHRQRLRLATFEGDRIDDTETTRDFDFKAVLKPPVDVYGLGALLWAIGEEHYGDVKKRIWVRSPEWYRELVEMCLHEDPRTRPTAAGVLLRLIARRTILFFTG